MRKPLLSASLARRALICYVLIVILLFLGKKKNRSGCSVACAAYNITHFLRLTGSGGSRAARIASSKTFLRPFCVSAEHSTYLTAFNSLASFSPCSIEMGFCLFLASFSMVELSSRRSTWVPTRRKGVF